MNSLSKKIAIVTGASSGIGRATAKLFAKEGATLVVAARRGAELNILVKEVVSEGGKAIAMPGDVKDEDFARGLVDLAKTEFGGVDIAFNNAGIIGEGGPISSVSLEQWEDTIRNNLTSAFLAAKYQVPAMIERGGGSLIFTSTFVGYTVGLPEMAAYSASKSGLIGLTQSLAAELGSCGVRVNSLLPGGTDTPMGRSFASTPESLAFVQGLHSLKRMALPEEIARSALYLASDASSFTTGTALLADGGVSINRT